VQRAPGTCSQPGCAGIPLYRGRCLEHAQWNAYPERQRGRILQRRRARLIHTRGARCQRCRRTHVELELHHLDGDASNDDDRNLELLCRDCHRAATRTAT
jgi:5-methylcytosine-specific restriction endonuclease McrA